MVIEGEDGKATTQKQDIIKLSGDFAVAGPIENALTLAHCDYYFDGELQEKNGYVLNIAERANALERRVKIHQDYHIRMNYVPSTLYLVCETPEKFDILVNGKEIDKKICGYFRDVSFKKIDITKYLELGDNTISFDCDFVQRDEFYQDLRNAFVFESEKNKLSYDMEIEAIYLVGDFSVNTDGVWEALDKDAVRYTGGFEIDKQRDKISLKNIEQQGYPFFSGEMRLAGEIEIAGENPVLELDRKGVNAVRVKIGDTEKVMLTDDRLPLADFGVSGKVKVELTLINNLRNLLGPHHLEMGECYGVGPDKFFKEKCIWATSPEEWNDGYCFVVTDC